GMWLRDEEGKPLRKVQHICWDGCMFPNAVMMNPETWTQILSTMLHVRNAHGWME
ncbi:MAG: sugar phosphate isomerase/epimerase, partial [Acidobacteriaceae bacterium]|nr:sugar phosphate isomerase/epimerase [Acidobacteriaceae bacterium]